jgi:hypothetical protein
MLVKDNHPVKQKAALDETLFAKLLQPLKPLPQINPHTKHSFPQIPNLLDPFRHRLDRELRWIKPFLHCYQIEDRDRYQPNSAPSNPNPLNHDTQL